MIIDDLALADLAARYLSRVLTRRLSCNDLKEPLLVVARHIKRTSLNTERFARHLLLNDL